MDLPARPPRYGPHHTYFPDPSRVDLELNYHNFPDVLQLGSEVIARCEVKLAKTLRAVKGAEKEPCPSPAPASSPAPSPSSPLSSAPLSRAVSTPHVEFVHLGGGTDREFQEAQAECVCQLITRLLADGVEPPEIIVLSRFTFGYGAARDLVQVRNLAPVETSKGSALIRPGIRFTTIHKSKGLERDHVILLNAVSALFGFPPQIPSSFALRVLAPDVTDPLDEERRLFFVAVTRAKQAVHVCTWAENDSEFLLENPLFQTSTAATLTTVGLRGIVLDATPDALHVKVEDPLRGLGIVQGARLTIPRLMLYSPVDARPGEMQVIFVSRAWLATQSPPPVPAFGGRSWNKTLSAARFSPSSGISSQNRTGVIFD